jgi:hypothetical protein
VSLANIANIASTSTNSLNTISQNKLGSFFNQIAWNPFKGILDFIAGLLDNILKGLVTYVLTLILNWINGMAKGFFIMMYSICAMTPFLMIDFLELFFRRIAGLDGKITVNGEEVNGDLVLAFIQSDAVWKVFLSFIIVAVGLLFMSTIIAIIRTEMASEKDGNSKGPIFGKAIRAIALFVIVPVASITGIMVSNLLLKVVDGVSKSDSRSSISGMLFYTGVQRANRIQQQDDFAWAFAISAQLSGRAHTIGFNDMFKKQYGYAGTTKGSDYIWWSKETEDINDLKTKSGSKLLEDSVWGAQFSDLATQINFAFRNKLGWGDYSGVQFTNVAPWFFTDYIAFAQGATTFVSAEDSFTLDTYMRGILAVRQLVSFNPLMLAGFSVYNIDLIWYFYNPFLIDYVLIILTATTIIQALMALSIGAAKRIYELCVLFVISPAVVALIPLSDEAYKNWFKNFRGRVLSFYGGVLGINFFFMISPVVMNINFFPEYSIINVANSANYFEVMMNYLPQLLMLTAGVQSIKSISKMISGMIGAEDSLADGEGMMKETMGKIGGALRFAGSVAGGPALAAMKAGGKLASGINKTMGGKKDGEDDSSSAKLAGDTEGGEDKDGGAADAPKSKAPKQTRRGGLFGKDGFLRRTKADEQASKNAAIDEMGLTTKKTPRLNSKLGGLGKKRGGIAGGLGKKIGGNFAGLGKSFKDIGKTFGGLGYAVNDFIAQSTGFDVEKKLNAYNEKKDTRAKKATKKKKQAQTSQEKDQTSQEKAQTSQEKAEKVAKDTQEELRKQQEELRKQQGKEDK